MVLCLASVFQGSSAGCGVNDKYDPETGKLCFDCGDFDPKTGLECESPGCAIKQLGTCYTCDDKHVKYDPKSGHKCGACAEGAKFDSETGMQCEHLCPHMMETAMKTVMPVLLMAIFLIVHVEDITISSESNFERKIVIFFFRLLNLRLCSISSEWVKTCLTLATAYAVRKVYYLGLDVSLKQAPSFIRWLTSMRWLPKTFLGCHPCSWFLDAFFHWCSGGNGLIFWTHNLPARLLTLFIVGLMNDFLWWEPDEYGTSCCGAFMPLFLHLVNFIVWIIFLVETHIYTNIATKYYAGFVYDTEINYRSTIELFYVVIFARIFSMGVVLIIRGNVVKYIKEKGGGLGKGPDKGKTIISEQIKGQKKSPAPFERKKSSYGQLPLYQEGEKRLPNPFRRAQSVTTSFIPATRAKDE